MCLCPSQSVHDGKFFAAHVLAGEACAPQEERLLRISADVPVVSHSRRPPLAQVATSPDSSTRTVAPLEVATSPDAATRTVASRAHSRIEHLSPSSAARFLRSWWMLDGVRTPRASPVKRGRSGVAPTLRVLPESLGGSLTAHRLTPMLAWLGLGGDVNATDAKGRTLLHFASATGLEDAVCELLRCGADVNARQQRGNTPLTYATMNSHRAVVRLLLAARANANLADDKGLTPLMWAARRGSTTMVKLLLEGGAQTALRDSTGLTVMGHAKSHSRAAVEKRIGLLLRQHLRTSVPQQQDQEVAEEQQEAGSRDSRGKEQQHDQYV